MSSTLTTSFTSDEEKKADQPMLPTNAITIRTTMNLTTVPSKLLRMSCMPAMLI